MFMTGSIEHAIWTQDHAARVSVLPSPSFQIADRWTSFSRILVWFCGFYSQFFLNRERERKTTRRTRENDAGITRPSKKSRSYRYWNHRSSRQNCFTVTCETERWCGGKKGQVMLGDTVDIIVSSFITLLERKTVVCGSSRIHHWSTPSDVDRFARFSWDWPSRDGKLMSIKPPWLMLKSAQRKANAKETQHASLIYNYDERPVGKLQDETKLAAFFAFFCLSVLHTLRLDRTWSLFMMQTGQKYCWSWGGFVFDIFNFADFTTAFPYCGKHVEFP